MIIMDTTGIAAKYCPLCGRYEKERDANAACESCVIRYRQTSTLAKQGKELSTEDIIFIGNYRNMMQR